MDIRFGNTVFSRDNHKVGELREVVVDPVSRELTHLVVRQGLLFSDDRIVAMKDVAHADDRSIILARDAEELEEQTSPFLETSFATVPGTESDLPQRIWTQPPGSPSIIPPGIRPDDLSPDPSIPMDDVSLLQNSPVQCANGTQVGTVQQVFVDKADRITHIVMRCVGVYDEFKLIPLDWIRGFEDNVVVLGVEEGVVHQLADYEEPPAA
ncbi:MAG: PRC-barrel domain-containing protein [bacterium]